MSAWKKALCIALYTIGVVLLTLVGSHIFYTSPVYEMMVCERFDDPARQALCRSIASQASADTGLSLHDTDGNAPRSQINLTIPWTGKSMKQLAGRSHRLGSKTDTKLHWLFTDGEPDEIKRAGIVAKKMQILGATSKGMDVSDSDDIYKALMDFMMGTKNDDELVKGDDLEKSFRLVVFLR